MQGHPLGKEKPIGFLGSRITMLPRLLYTNNPGSISPTLHSFTHEFARHSLGTCLGLGVVQGAGSHYEQLSLTELTV